MNLSRQEQENKINPRLITSAMVFTLFLALALIIYVAIVATSEAGMCMQNPLVYASLKLSEANNRDFSGEGSFQHTQEDYVNNRRYPRVSFNKSSVSIIRNIEGINTRYEIPNFTEVLRMANLTKG